MGVSAWCVMRVYVVRASSCVNDMYEYAGASHTALHLLFRACLRQKVNHEEVMDDPPVSVGDVSMWVVDKCVL